MSIYQKKLKQLISSRYSPQKNEELLDALFRVGVVDWTLVKVLVIREYVAELTREGESKLNAMWQATEIFACTYEYVRKCIYYYKDVNLK